MIRCRSWAPRLVGPGSMVKRSMGLTAYWDSAAEVCENGSVPPRILGVGRCGVS